MGLVERGAMRGCGFADFLSGFLAGRPLRVDRPEGFGVLLDVASDADGKRALVLLGAGGEDAFEDAVDEQVGIAADGRGEVGVAGGGEGKVAVVDFGIARLLERAQHEVADDALLGLAGDFGGELLVHGRGDRRSPAGFRSRCGLARCAVERALAGR